LHFLLCPGTFNALGKRGSTGQDFLDCGSGMAIVMVTGRELIQPVI
jgi:hypothetical protein